MYISLENLSTSFLPDDWHYSISLSLYGHHCGPWPCGFSPYIDHVRPSIQHIKRMLHRGTNGLKLATITETSRVLLKSIRL